MMEMDVIKKMVEDEGKVIMSRYCAINKATDAEDELGFRIVTVDSFTPTNIAEHCGIAQKYAQQVYDMCMEQFDNNEPAVVTIGFNDNFTFEYSAQVVTEW